MQPINLRSIAVRNIAATSRISLRDERGIMSGTKRLARDFSFSSCADQAQHFLEELGFTVVAQAESRVPGEHRLLVLEFDINSWTPQERVGLRWVRGLIEFDYEDSWELKRAFANRGPSELRDRIMAAIDKVDKDAPIQGLGR